MAPLDVNLIADWFLNRVDKKALRCDHAPKITEAPLFRASLAFGARAHLCLTRKFKHGPTGQSCSIYDRFKGQGWGSLDFVDFD